MLPDENLGKAAISALAGQASEESTKLLLTSFNDYGPVPNSGRFEQVVQGLDTMLEQNPEKPGLAITIESLMTTSSSSVTRAAAVSALSNSPTVNAGDLSEALKKMLQYETDQQVRLYIQQALNKMHSPSP